MSLPWDWARSRRCLRSSADYLDRMFDFLSGMGFFQS